MLIYKCWLTQNSECLLPVHIPNLSLTEEKFESCIQDTVNTTNHTIKLKNFSRTCLPKIFAMFARYYRLYQGHKLLRHNQCFHQTKSSYCICKFLLPKQEKCYKSTQICLFVFLIFWVFCSKSPFG